jgi:uncharacterized protein (DUF4415 family)
MYLKAKSGRKVFLPSDEEDVHINAGIAQDPDSPEWTEEDFKNAIPFDQLPEDQKAVLSAIQQGKVEFTETPDAEFELGKQRITIMLDAQIIKAYKAKAGGRGYQTLINETLRRGLLADSVKEALREVIREERG